MMTLASETNTQDISMCFLGISHMVLDMQTQTPGPNEIQNSLTQSNNINQRPMNHMMG